MAKIFISYTAKDRAWAQWIGVTLRDNGHTPFVHEWEIGAGQNIPHWMNEKLDLADNLLGVFSDAYTKAIYSGAERDAAFWEDPSGRDGFLIPVEIETVSRWPPLVKPLKRLSLVGKNEAEAETALIEFLEPPKPPDKRPPFPGRHTFADKRTDLDAVFEAGERANVFAQDSEPLPESRPRLPAALPETNLESHLSADASVVPAKRATPLDPAGPPKPPPPDAPPTPADEVPDPSDRTAFEAWLKTKPREWSVVIAARAALRVLPLAFQGFGTREPVDMLQLFRATAITRFTAVYPNRAIERAAHTASNSALATSLGPAAAANAASNAANLAASRETSLLVFLSIADAATSSALDAASLPGAESAIARAAREDAQDAIRADMLELRGGKRPERFARSTLWSLSTKVELERFRTAWANLKIDLRRLRYHWQVWIDWYDEVLAGTPPAPARSEAWEAAFTDVEDPSYPWQGPLPWEDGPEAVNLAIQARLDAVQKSEQVTAPSEPTDQRPATIAELAEAASPAPSVTPDGRLDAGPNPKFDIPAADHELPSLPIRQRTLIAVILSDLPLNAPVHVRTCLSSYDDELKARGVQPILGLLKDMADIIEAAVHAVRADEEWLEAGLRMAFTRFAENHGLFLEHFPLDPQREELYQRTPVDEDAASDRTLRKPIEDVAEAAHLAQRAGSATPDFVVVIDKFIELWRVVATLPPPSLSSQRSEQEPPPGTPEVRVGPGDRIEPVTPKKRFILSILGFFERTYNLIGSTVTIAGGGEAIGTLGTALRKAIEVLSKLLS